MGHEDQPLTIEKPSDLPGSPMSSRIGFDHPCCFCGYNLRSLTLSGFCPECGAKVNDALRGARMRFQPIPWINRLRLGARLAFWGVVGIMVTVITATILLIITLTSNFWLAPDWVNWALLAVFVISAELLAVGMVLFSWSSPILVRRKQIRAAVTRTSAMCIMVALPIATMMSLSHDYAVVRSAAMTLVHYICNALLLFGFPLLYFFGLLQVMALSRLIPYKRGARRSLVLMIYGPVAIVLWFISNTVVSMILASQMMQATQGGASQYPSMDLYWIVFAVGAILLFIAMTMTAGLFAGLSRQIGLVRIDAAALLENARLASLPVDDQQETKDIFTGVPD